MADSTLAADLKRRVPSAVALGLLALAATWYGGFPFLLFWAIAGTGIWFEWATLMQVSPRTTVLGAGALAVVTVAVLLSVKLPALAVAAALAGVLIIGLLVRAANMEQRTWAGAGIVYGALAFLPIVLLREDAKFGLYAAIWIYAVVWLTDIAAYFVGKAFGGAKLVPNISPGKTWSGAIGGLVFGALGGMVVALYATATFSVMHIVIAALVSAFSQAGDVFESYVKRSRGQKDSSSIIPGHGGLMDRLDAFIAASLLALLIGIAHGGVSEPARGLLQW